MLSNYLIFLFFNYFRKALFCSFLDATFIKISFSLSTALIWNLPMQMQMQWSAHKYIQKYVMWLQCIFSFSEIVANMHCIALQSRYPGVFVRLLLFVCRVLKWFWNTEIHKAHVCLHSVCTYTYGRMYARVSASSFLWLHGHRITTNRIKLKYLICAWFVYLTMNRRTHRYTHTCM